VPPRWMSYLGRAARRRGRGIAACLDPQGGWRAFASGGLDAMRDLADGASGESDVLCALIDKCWALLADTSFHAQPPVGQTIYRPLAAHRGQPVTSSEKMLLADRTIGIETVLTPRIIRDSDASV
jgi:hypothetical protein